MIKKLYFSLVLLFVISCQGSFLVADNACNDVEKSTSGSPKSFYFIRHGRTDWSKEMLELGPQDLSLNSIGIQEVKAALPALKRLNISKIITGPLKRCRETAQIISESLGGIMIEVDPRIEERRFGNWGTQKEAAAELRKLAGTGPEFFGAIKDKIENILPSDAETGQDFEARIMDYFYCSNFNQRGDTILIIGHGCIQLALLNHLNVTTNTVGQKKYAMPIIFQLNGNGSWELHPAFD